jgi:ferredoxin-NADP reductase
LPLVFIAGGIGITPFYSMLKQRVHDGLPLNATLVYNSRTDDVPFKNELDHWAEEQKTFKIIYSVGQHLSAEYLMDLLPNLKVSLVYMSGPEPMVEALGDKLKASGLPEDQLVQDFFPNYSESNY